MAVFVAAIPWLIGASGVAAWAGAVGYAAGGGVSASRDLIKYGLLASTAVGAYYVYKKL